MGATSAAKNRKIRQEAMREQLSAGGHVQHVIDISDKLCDLSNELDSTEVARLKAAADIKKGLIGKYLPDMKQQEIELGGKVDLDHELWVGLIKDNDPGE